MATQITASSKGQVVLPKRTRDRLGIASGTLLDVIDTPTGVELRLAKKPDLTVEEAVRKLRSIVRYNGPRIDEAAIQEAIGEAIEEKWRPRLR